MKDPFAHLRAWDRHIHAFTRLDAGAYGQDVGPLAGLHIGVKDIIDVAGLPTKCGSVTRADVAPAEQDAAVVASLRGAGARIVGKTVTTEFAFTDPTSCRNPHDLTRSPGGSSSGSGAAVAAGVVDIALGTQTAGSLCRPAAYCGAVGFKPTAGVLSLDGVAPLAPSFDTVGIIARNTGLARTAFEAMTAGPRPDSGPVKPSVMCGVWDDDTPVAPDWSHALSEAAQVLNRDTVLRALPADTVAIVAAHRTVMCAEAADAHGDILDDARAPLLGPKFRAGLIAGRNVSKQERAEAHGLLRTARHAFWQALGDVDLVVTLPVPDGAPLIGMSTGFQDWLTPWTVFGGPLLCLPWGVDGLSRPRAVMLAAHPGQDSWLLQIASDLEASAPACPAPHMPA